MGHLGEMWPLAAYVALKLVAYTLWCSLLVGWRGASYWRGAPGLGLLRLALGLALGAGLAAAGIHLQWGGSAILPFLALLLPIRWLEWSVAAHVGLGTTPSVATLLLGPDGRARTWQAGGVLVSFATDLGLVLAAGMVRALVC